MRSGESVRQGRRAARRLAGRTLLLLATMACSRSPQGGEWPPDGLGATAQSNVEAWLFCDECDRGERANAAGTGEDAVRPLAGLLARIPAQWIDNLRSRYSAAAVRARVTAGDSAAYVERHLANFTATVQSRSAFTLGDIRTPAAISELQSALDSATARSYRGDVIRAVEQALRSATIPAFGGVIRPAPAAFLDTVWVIRGGQTWDGDEAVVLHGAPFPNDVMTVRSTDSLGLVAIGEVGEYALSITNIGPNQLSEVGSLRILSFPGPRPGTVDLTAAPLPRTILGSLSRGTAPPDLVHYFQFQPGTDLTVTPVAEWTGPSQIDLLWDACQRRGTGAGSPGAVRGRVLIPSGDGLVGAEVQLAGTAIAAVTGVGGTFNLGGAPAGWRGTVRATRIGFAPVEVPVWEGLDDVTVIVGGPPSVASPHLGPSPNAAPITIPAGACRLLAVIKSDTLERSTILRLRITSP